MKKYCLIILGIDICCLLIILGRSVSGYKMQENTTAILQNGVQATEAAIQVDKPRIAITFDDGPNAEYTPILLDGLKERNVKATFFIIGNKIEGNEDILRRMRDEGHIIGNHTYSHVQLTRLNKENACEEIQKTCDKIYEVTGKYAEFIRPPFGSWNERIECDVDMFPVNWTIDPLDWTTKNTELIVQRVLKHAENNGIILLHDNYKSSVQAAFKIIDILQERGYEFVTVEELLLE